MAEYIDRATLYAELDSKLDGRPMGDTVPWLTCMGVVRKFPAADVVEVVWCKDCIHRPSRIHGAEDEREGLNLEFPDYWCPMQCEDDWYNIMPRDDFFCGYGERKVGDNG